MTHELVQKLHDAGYPVSTPDVPDLSELIEACGNDFGQLRLSECEEETVFNAYPSTKKLKEKKEWYLAFGKTPEEAVANLWLELNKK